MGVSSQGQGTHQVERYEKVESSQVLPAAIWNSQVKVRGHTSPWGTWWQECPHIAECPHARECPRIAECPHIESPLWALFSLIVTLIGWAVDIFVILCQDHGSY